MANEDDGGLVDLPLGDLSRFSGQMEALTRSASQFSSTLTSGMKSALLDGKSLDVVIRQMALTLSTKVLTSSFNSLVSLAGSAVSSVAGSGGSSLLSGLVSGAVPLLGSVMPFAKGGVVASPTYFGLESGLGVAGEAGAEAILPLSRGADGRLGIRSGRESAQGPRVQINVAARDAESFRRSEAQISAMVARAVGRGRRGL
ncbi:phage tail tape measure protein [Roseibium litorale]|uniref:Phage tail tape measure protein n=1 Tax=Roseibium litorale TaxID=2803841 RepID=A0ABR9CRI6_9HYPH|nr:phage tail tape measure protein [Roseibium litorale]MBD8893492.1 phage tail tape measure protein [Roseibium litorale]